MKTVDVRSHEDLIEYLKTQTGYAHLRRTGDGKRVYEMMMELTSFLPTHTNPKIRADFIVRGLGAGDVSKCPHCENRITVEKSGSRWAKTCGSSECTAKQKKLAAIQTSRERYGTDFPNQNVDVYLNGTHRGMVDKYGAHHTQTSQYRESVVGRTRSDETKKAISESMKSTFSDETKRKDILDRRAATYKQRTGYDSPSKNPCVIEKCRVTQSSNYGGWYLSSEDAKLARIAAFGSDNFFATEEFRRMASGRMHHLQNDVMVETLHRKDWCQSFIESNGLDLMRMAKETNSHLTTTISWLTKHGLYDSTPRGETLIETIIREILDGLGVEFEVGKFFVIAGVRRQADFYIPSKNLAIECNGNYYHSDLMKPDGYHLEKTELFASIGIDLLHFFEDEILDKRDIVSTMLAARLTETESIGARKVSVVSLDSSTAGHFYDEYHIQGRVKASCHYGLVTKDGRLVAAMSFKHYGRNLKDGETELVRFASSVRVVGGFTKLINRAIKDFGSKYHSVVSYADRRVSRGNVYIVCGFDHVATSAPSYYYMRTTNILKRLRKENFKKSLIKEHLDFYDESLSERENMKKNGFCRIYDCGLLKFVKKIA